MTSAHCTCSPRGTPLLTESFLAKSVCVRIPGQTMICEKVNKFNLVKRVKFILVISLKTSVITNGKTQNVASMLV